jgi:hypothetical protein
MFRGDKYFVSATHLNYIANLEREANLKRNERAMARPKVKNLITDFDADCVICFDCFEMGQEVVIFNCDAHHVLHAECYETMI